MALNRRMESGHDPREIDTMGARVDHPWVVWRLHHCLTDIGTSWEMWGRRKAYKV